MPTASRSAEGVTHVPPSTDTTTDRSCAEAMDDPVVTLTNAEKLRAIERNLPGADA
jgi:hypothetical protein